MYAYADVAVRCNVDFYGNIIELIRIFLWLLRGEANDVLVVLRRGCRRGIAYGRGQRELGRVADAQLTAALFSAIEYFLKIIQIQSVFMNPPT